MQIRTIVQHFCFFTFLTVLLATQAANAQKVGENYKTGEISYVYLERGPDTLKALPTQIVSFYFELYAVRKGKPDSLLNSTRAMGNAPAAVPAINAAALDNLMSMFAIGDSVKAILPSSKFPQLGMTAEESVRISFRVLKFYSYEEYNTERMKQQAELEAKIKVSEDAYMTQALSGIPNIQRTPEGLYYVIEQAGAGENPKKGDEVTVHYEGTLLRDGKKFDSSYDRQSPFSTKIGVGQVIKGWDMGIPLLKPGGKATLFIPSYLAYGSRDMGDIPAFSTLIFKVELLSIKPANP